MSESIKFAGKNDNSVVTPVSVSNEGYIRNQRIYNNTYTDIVNEVLSITEKTFYEGYDARNTGILSIMVWNRSGVDMTIQFYNPTVKGTGNALMAIYDIDGNLPVITIPSGKPTLITGEDIPILNYMPWINISLTPSGTPSTSDTSVVRVFSKR